MTQSLVSFWRNGLEQPIINEASSKRQPAFDYAQLEKVNPQYPDMLPEIYFQTSNWNDIMMSPLRALLEYVQFGSNSDAPESMQENLKTNFHFLDPSIFGNTADAILISNDGTISVQWQYNEDQHSYIINIPNYDSFLINIYKSRGRIESITGLALDSLPIDIEDVDALYEAFDLKHVSYIGR